MSEKQSAVAVPNYLVGGILATLFCCLPTGIASIVFASRASSKAAIGDTQGALADASKAKLWLWLSVIPGFLMAMLGILAAVAIPAYQDYTARVKVSEAILGASAMRTSYMEFVSANHVWPRVTDLNLSNEARYKTGVYSITINDEHAIEITVDGGISRIKGQTVLLVPTVEGNEISAWTCTAGTMPQRYLPSSCRH